MASYSLSEKLRLSTRSTSTGQRVTALIQWIIPPLTLLLILVLWTIVAESGRYPKFLLPHPEDVFKRLNTLYERGELQKHVAMTIREALTGLAISVGLALPLGYLVARSRWISTLLMPYLVAIRAIPVVAIAAIIVIWLGTDIKSKVFVVTFITWFPMMEATVVGIRSVDPNLRDLMRSYQARLWQVFFKLELPAAMPNVLSGLKISATLSVVGAAVGELISPNIGLAYLIVSGRARSDAAQVFGAVLLLTLISLTLYAIVAVAEHFVLAWRRAE